MIKLMKCPYCGRVLRIEAVDDPVKQYCWKCSSCEYRRPNTGIESISLNELRDEIYSDAVEHGLWGAKDYPSDCAWAIREEADELCDAGNDWEDEGWYEGEEYTAFSEELADVIIMSMSVAGKLGIDIDAAIRRKMAVNKERPWKHGKED